MKFSLFTTKINKSLYHENQKLFLGKWCLATEIDYKKFGDYKTADYHWDDEEKINNDYKYLYTLYYQILDVLSSQLNKIHKTENNQRYWHIIIGSWLYKFLITSYDKWESIRITFDNFSISKVFYYKTDYSELIASDCTEFNKIVNTEIWNNFLYTEIIKFQKKNTLNYTKLDFQNTKEKNYELNKYGEKSNFFLKFIDKFLSILSLRSNVVLYKTYFGKASDLKIFLKSLTIPRIYADFEKKISLPSPKNRQILKLDFEPENSFEEFIKQNIFKFMPISYLEGFSKIDKYYKNLNLNPKLIVSAVGDRYDSFSIWVASKIDKSKYFCTEHGGCTEDTEQFDARNKKGDCFLSWNFSEKKNVFQISPKFYTKKIKKNFLKKGKKLSIILSTPSTIYRHQLHYDLNGKQSLEAYEQIRNLKKLPNKIRDNISFRLHFNSNLWLMKERITKDFGKNYIFSQKKLDDVFMDSKILINMDFQTSFYQSMYSGKPVIVFTQRKFTNTFNPKIKNLFESFLESKIVFTNISDLLSHIENIWSDPYEWWDSKEIINLREKFNLLCSKKTNNKLEDEVIILKEKYENSN